MEIHSDAVNRGSNNREIDTSTPHPTAQSLVERLLEIPTSKTNSLVHNSVPNPLEIASMFAKERLKAKASSTLARSFVSFDLLVSDPSCPPPPR